MARKVAFKQQGIDPDWLIAGKHALAAERGQSVIKGEISQEQVLTLDARTARRFARIAEFLEQHYPAYLDGKKSVKAGSAAVLELIKLHQIAPKAADQVADACLSGELTVAQLRAKVEEGREKPEIAYVRPRQDASRWTADFEALVLERLEQGRLLPDFDQIDKIEVLKSKEPLVPDFLVHSGRAKRITAVEVKAPRNTAARSVSTVATELVSRLAVLSLRYENVVLVLPKEAAEIAAEAMELWEKWTKEELRQGNPRIVLL